MAVSDIPRVLLLLDQGKSMEALELSSKLIAEMPTHVTSYVVHARANESQGQYQSAFQSWRQALDLMPNSPQILKGLLRTADKLAKPADSLDEFKFMGWTKDRSEIAAQQYRFVPAGRDGLVSTSGNDVTSGESLVAEKGDLIGTAVDDSNEVPVFVDTDLPNSERTFELDLSKDDTDLQESNLEIDIVEQEQVIVVTSGEGPDFRSELDTSADTPVAKSRRWAAGTSLQSGNDGSHSAVAKSIANSTIAATAESSLDSTKESELDSSVASAADEEYYRLAASAFESAELEEVSPDVNVGAGAVGDKSETVEASIEQADEKPKPASTSGSSLDDLDNLIVELETARIVPRPDDDPAPTPDLGSDVEGMVSETLARIYAAQNQFSESARIYDKLAAIHPVRAAEFRAKSAEMRSRTS